MTNRKRLKVRYHGAIAHTDKATLFLFGDREIWLPRWAFSEGPGWNLLIDAGIAEKKELRGVEYDPIHRPEKIDPVPNQEPIDELRYGPGGGD